MELTSNIHERLEQSNLPGELKAGLNALYSAVPPVLAAPNARGRRLTHLLNHLADEVCDPATPVHWWELTLFLLDEAASLVDDGGQVVAQLVAHLRPQLAEFIGPFGPVTLEKITDDTVLGICWLSDTLRPPQSNVVAPNVFSLAQAHFNEYAWFRAIYAGKAPVGFMMIVDDDKTPEYFLWRFMIASMFQGRGYGKQAIERLVDYVRTRPGAKELGVSCDEGDGSPEGFYRRLGFVRTGEMLDDEVVLKLAR